MNKDKKITVLMYHCIDDVDTDPWGICVSPQLFEEQVRYLANHHPVISIADAVQQVLAGAIQQHSICITFDDGYADNFLQAGPILSRYKCPATFFIPTAYIGAAQPFWWDELEYIFLHLPQLPSELALTINGQSFHYTLDDSAMTNSQWQQHRNWKWYHAPPTDRCAVFWSVWENLRPRPLPEIQEQLVLLRQWAGYEAPVGFRPPMTGQQLQEHFSNPLFTAGLHTHTHPDLGTMGESSQREEIETGRRLLQTIHHLNSTYLAYPYGRYNEATLSAVEALKLKACFTTEAVHVDADSNAATLGRYQVCNWDLNEFRSNLLL